MIEVNFALAPAGATHYDFFAFYFHWLKYDRAWLYFDHDDDSWELCEQCEPENEKEIPERERALNRLADLNQHDEETCRAWSIFFHEIKCRRYERIEAGLIEVDNPVTSSLTNSQAKEMELDMLKGEKWMPEIGEICEATWGVKVSWWLSVLKDNDGVWVKRTDDQLWSYLDIDETWEFRPLKTPDETPEQKAREDFALAAVEATETYDFGEYFTAEGARNMFDWLTDQGVDLMPILEEQTK